MTTTTTSTKSTAHYVTVRYVGLSGRVTGENEAPLRLVDGSVGVKRRGFILPVVAIEDGCAVVEIADKAGTALAETPRTAEGGYDFDALAKLYPAITNPWDYPALQGLKFRQPKAEPKAEAAPAKRTGLKVDQPKAAAKSKAPAKAAVKAEPAKAQPKAELNEDMVIAYLAGLSPDAHQRLIEGLVAAKGGKATKAKASPKAKKQAIKAL